MAELKRNFLKAKMNKDLDERLVPNGEYRDALNVEISSSEGSNVGSVQTLRSNEEVIYKVGDGYINKHKSAINVGSYVDEANGCIYSFVKDASNFTKQQLYGKTKKTGVRSDLIEKININNTYNGYEADSEIVIHDVYEVRVGAEAFVDDAGNPTIADDKVILPGKADNYVPKGYNAFQPYRNFDNIRAGMTVSVVDLNGQNAFGGAQKVVVTRVSTADGGKTIHLSSSPTSIISQVEAGQLDRLTYVFTAPRILNFESGLLSQSEVNAEFVTTTPTPTESLITAINVLDDYLLFTDGKNEPKKINIKRSILGNVTNSLGLNVGQYGDEELTNYPTYQTVPHTHLINKINNKFYSRGFLKEHHITTIKRNPLQALEIDLVINSSTSKNSNIQLGTFSTDTEELQSENFDFFHPNGSQYAEGSAIYFIVTQNITPTWNDGDTLILTGTTTNSVFILRIDGVFQQGTVVRCKIVKIDESYYSSFNNITVPQEPWLGTLVTETDLYPDKFVRFAYRYRYTDDEYSCISPYSEPAFLPKIYDFDSITGFNRGMENSINSIILKNIDQLIIPEDVKAVEFLFKTTGSENIYAFKQTTVSQKHLNPNYINSIYQTEQLGRNKIDKNFIEIKNESFGYVLPEDQATRTSDAVPVKALAQEIQANRLMYGNHTQGYDMLDNNNNAIEFNLTKTIEARTDQFTASFTSSAIFKNQQLVQHDSDLLATESQITNLDTGLPETVPYENAAGNQLYVSKSLDLPGVVFDNQNAYDSTTGVFTAPTNGTYTFRGSIKAEIRTRVGGFGYGSPLDYINPATGKHKGNAIPRQFALGIGRVATDGKPTIATLADDTGNLFKTTTFLQPTYTTNITTLKPRLFQEGDFVDDGDEGFFGDSEDDNDFDVISGFTTGIKRYNTNDNFTFLNDGVTLDTSTITTAEYFGNNNPTSSTKFYVYNYSNYDYDNNSLEISCSFNLTAGQRIGMFVYTDVGPDSRVENVELSNTVFYKDALFECTSAPGVTNNVATLQGGRSVKSDRNYHVGVVYADKNGRESSVIISEENDIFVARDFCNSQNVLSTKILSTAPKWAATYKMFIKETAVKYHNLVLDSAIENPDDSGTTAFLIFNKSDKDKIKQDDFLTIKKRHQSNEAVTEDVKFKVLDIQGVQFGQETSDSGETTTTVSVGGIDITDIVDADEATLTGKFFVKVANNSNFLEFVGDLNVIDSGLEPGTDSTNAAVFETIRTSNIDIDLYYEATQAIPIKLIGNLAQVYAKPGDKIVLEPLSTYAGVIPEAFQNINTTPLAILPGVGSVIGAASDNEICFPNSGDLQNKVKLRIGIAGDGYSTINVSGLTNKVLVKIYKQDGSYVSAFLSENYNPSIDAFIYLSPIVHPTASHPNNACPITLPWFNCYAFGNGVESDTIRDDFNAQELFLHLPGGKQSGFKANLPSTTFSQENNINEVIFSELYNEKSNTNRINEFLLAKDIIKILNPDYGSIQKLFSRNNDLLAFCEEKVIRILSQKDALFNADGSSQLTATNKVLGQSIPFKADYGISKNPESFAYDAYKAYFVDRSRGAVLRLSNDGITVISDYGMKDWFRDRLKNSEVAIGSFDSRKEEYNLTLHEVTDPVRYKNVYTISFAENVNGWSSFKSFIQEGGYTLANDYYTYKKGKPYLHHAESNTRNVFYGNKYNSSITPLFNDDPSSVKSFKSIYYEGSQSKVNQLLADNEYYNLKNKDGWFVESITTDLQEGTIQEFIDKEGKWFNYIKGETTLFTNFIDGDGVRNLDLSEFSVQGLGTIESIPSDDGDDLGVEIILGEGETEDDFGGGHSLIFIAVVSGVDDEGQPVWNPVDWSDLNPGFTSNGFVANNVTDIGGETFEVIFNVASNYQGSPNSVFASPSGDDISAANPVDNILLSVEYAPQEITIFDAEYGGDEDNLGYTGNIIQKLTILPEVTLTENKIVFVPIIPAEPGVGIAGQLSTDLIYNINESNQFLELIGASAEVDPIVDYVSESIDGTNVNYYLDSIDVGGNAAQAEWQQTGSYTVNATTTGNELQYIHSIFVESDSNGQGIAYFEQETAFNLTLIPSLNDGGLYQFDTSYEYDYYGNIWRIRVDIFYQRMPGQELATGTVIHLHVEPDQVISYFAEMQLSVTVPETIPDGFFITVPVTTNIPLTLSSGAETQWVLQGQWEDGETQWVQFLGTSIVDNNTFDVAFVNIQDLPDGLSSRNIQFFLYTQFSYDDGLPRYDNINIIQDDGPSIAVSLIDADGDVIATTAPLTVEGTDFIESTIVATPSVIAPEVGEAGDYVYEIEIITDTNEYLDSFNSGLITIFNNGNPNMIWPVNAENQVEIIGDVDNGSYRYKFYIGNNPSTENRTCSILVQHPANGDINHQIFITQDGLHDGNPTIGTDRDLMFVSVGSGEAVGTNSEQQSAFFTDQFDTNIVTAEEFITSAVVGEVPYDGGLPLLVGTEKVRIQLRPVDYKTLSPGNVPFNMLPTPGTAYGKPRVYISSNTVAADGLGAFLQNDTLSTNYQDDNTSYLIKAEEIEDVSALGYGYDFRTEYEFAPNNTFFDRSFFISAYHPQNSYYTSPYALAPYPDGDGGFSAALPRMDARVIVAQPAGNVLRAWNTDAYEASNIQELDDGSVYQVLPNIENIEAIAPPEIELFCAFTGATPQVVIVKDGLDGEREEMQVGVEVNNLTLTQGITYTGYTIPFSDSDATPVQVYSFKVQYSTNMTFVTRPNGIELYHESQPFPDNNIGVKAFFLSQSPTPYDEALNDVRFVDDFGGDLEAVTLAAGEGNFNVKVLVTDYEQEDFDAEQVVSTDGNVDIFNAGNKRPQFYIEYYGIFQQVFNLEINQTLFNSAEFQSNNIIKNPNFPEGAGENFFQRPGVFGEVLNFTAQGDLNIYDAQYGINTLVGVGGIAQSQVFLQADLENEILTSVQFVPNYINEIILLGQPNLPNNGEFTTVLPITVTDANEFDGILGENPHKFVFTYTVSAASHPTYTDYEADENGFNQAIGLRLMGTDFDSNSMLAASQMDLDSNGNFYQTYEGNNLKTIPSSPGTHSVTFRATGQYDGSNNKLILGLNGLISGAPLILEDMSLQRIGHTHTVNIPHALNTQLTPETYELKVNHAWNETGFDGEVNDTLDITKKALNNFDFATASFTATIQVDDGTSNLFDPGGVGENLFAVTSLPASVKWLLRGQNATSPAAFRFMTTQTSDVIFDPTADSAEFSPDNNISLPPQVLGFYYERYSNEGDGVLRDDELVTFQNVQNISLNNIPGGLRLGVSHQRYIDTFGSYNTNVGGEDINFGHAQPIYMCQTSAELTNPDTGEFDIPRSFTLGAIPNTSYPNLVNLTSDDSFVIEYNNNNDIDNNAVIEILGEDSLRWNVGNAVQVPDPNVTVLANNSSAYAVLKLKVPDFGGGAEYRVSFTTENWTTKQFGDNNIQINNKQTLAQTSGFGNYADYAITTHRVDMVNGRFVKLNANDNIRVGANVEDVITFSTIANNILESPIPPLNTYAIPEDDIDSIIAHVGNASYCNILRPKHHQPSESADNFIALELRFPFNVSFILNNLKIEQVTDSYRNVLFQDPYEDGTNVENLENAGTGVTDRYTIFQNPSVVGQHRFINESDGVGSVLGTPMTNVAIESGDAVTTNGFGAITLQAGSALNFQIRSKHLAGQVNTSKLAISLDGGITYRISGLVGANDGIVPLNIAHAASAAVGGQGNVPIGQLNPGGAGNDIKKWNLRIIANLVVADNNVIGEIDTASREFKIGLFDNISIDGNSLDLTAPGCSPIEVFTIIQSGIEFDGENVGLVDDDSGIVNSGNSII